MVLLLLLLSHLILFFGAACVIATLVLGTCTDSISAVFVVSMTASVNDVADVSVSAMIAAAPCF